MSDVLRHDLSNWPTVSIVIVALNCAENIGECITRIKNQDYPLDSIEIHVIDGGSTDGTQKVASSMGATVIDGGYRDNSEPRRGIGLLKSQNEIVAYIESDIFLPTNQWLKQMVRPLIENDGIVACQSLRYEYRRKDRLLNRYFALMGCHDPIAFYLRKRDKLTWYEKKWKLFGKAIDVDDFYKVTFNVSALPPLGCNGFVARRHELQTLTLPDVAELPRYTHSDSVYDLVSQGQDTFAFVKNTVIHVPSNEPMWRYVARRMAYTKTLHFGQLERKYKVYDFHSLRDNVNLMKFSIYSITVIKPLFDSLRGFVNKPDRAWFVHPAICLMMFIGYSFITVRQLAVKVFTRRTI